VSRNVRFLVSLIPAIVLLFGAIEIVGFVAERLGGGLGLVLGLVCGGSLVLSLLLVYYNAIDWLNLRLLRRDRASEPLSDGDVVALSGLVRADDPPTAPFSGEPCAAYTYTVSESRHSTRRGRSTRFVVAEGFHLVPTHIERPSGSLAVRALPGFEDDLRITGTGGELGERAADYVEALSARASSAGERERRASLLDARHGEVEEVHADYCQSSGRLSSAGLTVEEQRLPVDVEVCVIGTYDETARALTARRPRLGPNLMVYRGSREEVVTRLGSEVAWFARAAAVLLGVGLLVLGFAYLSPT
jgi:hypothetical protein